MWGCTPRGPGVGDTAALPEAPGRWVERCVLLPGPGLVPTPTPPCLLQLWILASHPQRQAALRGQRCWDRPGLEGGGCPPRAPVCRKASPASSQAGLPPNSLPRWASLGLGFPDCMLGRDARGLRWISLHRPPPGSLHEAGPFIHQLLPPTPERPPPPACVSPRACPPSRAPTLWSCSQWDGQAPPPRGPRTRFPFRPVGEARTASLLCIHRAGPRPCKTRAHCSLCGALAPS